MGVQLRFDLVVIHSQAGFFGGQGRRNHAEHEKEGDACGKKRTAAPADGAHERQSPGFRNPYPYDEDFDAKDAARTRFSWAKRGHFQTLTRQSVSAGLFSAKPIILK